jgi:hypothetical protein
MIGVIRIFQTDARKRFPVIAETPIPSFLDPVSNAIDASVVQS